MRDIYMVKGKNALKNRDYLIAATYYEKALYVDPGYPPAKKGLEESDGFLRTSVSSETAKPYAVRKNREIDLLLTKAEEQFRTKKLTYPGDGNAFMTAQEILSLEPGNKKALTMIEKIRDEYIQMGDNAFRKRNFKKAKMYFGRALSVSPGFQHAQKMMSEAESLVGESAQELPEDMVLIQGGCYRMGDTFGDGFVDELPVHRVCIDSFFIDRHEVTQKEFTAWIGSNPSSFSGDQLPADGITWFEAKEFCERTGRRLPTEAEWEFAARSRGKEEKWAGINSEALLDDFAWYDMNSQEKTHPVGLKKANASGLYDMSGGVYEWVADRYDTNYYAISPEKNPGGPDKGLYRVLRGGSWNSSLLYLRTTVRYRAKPGRQGSNFGFRCARDST
jgi:formylglycine-generating enzyme required for sulfatase activity